MTFKQPVDYAIEAIKELSLMVGWLADSLIQGAERQPKAPALTLDRRKQLAAEAHAERVERTDIAPGEGEAPMDLDVMEALAAILTQAEAMTVRVCIALTISAPKAASSAFADPRPTLRYLTRLLPDVIAHEVTRQVEWDTRKLIDDASEVLGLIGDGQVLKALCPWCDGRTEAKPNGGEHTLRIRTVRGMDATVVTCEGGLCSPPEAECGTWVRGRPAWLQSEWEWLAARLEQAS